MFEKLFQTWTGRKFYLGNLTSAYKAIPEIVLKDLGDFTRAYHVEGTFDKDPYEHARREGRREVWQRIMNHIHLRDDQIMSLYMDGRINE